jgi:hypothetical protein
LIQFALDVGEDWDRVVSRIYPAMRHIGFRRALQIITKTMLICGVVLPSKPGIRTASAAS